MKFSLLGRNGRILVDRRCLGGWLPQTWLVLGTFCLSRSHHCRMGRGHIPDMCWCLFTLLTETFSRNLWRNLALLDLHAKIDAQQLETTTLNDILGSRYGRPSSCTGTQIWEKLMMVEGPRWSATQQKAQRWFVRLLTTNDKVSECQLAIFRHFEKTLLSSTG